MAVGSPKGTFYRTYIIPSLFLQSTISMATAERLLLDNTWFDDGRLFASWRPSARRLLHQTRCNLHRELHRSLRRSCVHLKGHGGVKGALRRIMQQQHVHRYVARFDVARYYESIDHEVLLRILWRARRWSPTIYACRIGTVAEAV